MTTADTLSNVREIMTALHIVGVVNLIHPVLARLLSILVVLVQFPHLICGTLCGLADLALLQGIQDRLLDELETITVPGRV